jgi:hypothetical protein
VTFAKNSWTSRTKRSTLRIVAIQQTRTTSAGVVFGLLSSPATHSSLVGSVVFSAARAATCYSTLGGPRTWKPSCLEICFIRSTFDFAGIGCCLSLPGCKPGALHLAWSNCCSAEHTSTSQEENEEPHLGQLRNCLASEFSCIAAPCSVTCPSACCKCMQ